MKIELYSVPNDKNAELIKEFLEKNNLKFHEIITSDINLLRKVCQGFFPRLESLLRIKFRHSIHIIRGFEEHSLNQVLEHVKKYNPKIE